MCRASPAPACSTRIVSIQLPAFRAAVNFSHFDRRVRDHLQHLLVAPDVVLERRDVEIADQNGALGRRRAQSPRIAVISSRKSSLCSNFSIDLADPARRRRPAHRNYAR